MGLTEMPKVVWLTWFSMLLCFYRDVSEVLLSKGANPDSSYRNKPLLHLSLSLGHHCVASLLVEHGACVNMTDSRGETPLFAALSSDSNQTVRIGGEAQREC